MSESASKVTDLFFETESPTKSSALYNLDKLAFIGFSILGTLALVLIGSFFYIL